MPAGNNLGGQLNVILFELGMITRDPLGFLPDIVTTIAVHPLVVVPTSIRYQDSSRSQVNETHNGAIVTKAGRAARMLSLSGTFGVASRGLGLVIGTGDLRFKRFYHEIVRLSDAISKDQVDAEKDLFRSPFLNLALLPYDPERSTFFINYYDFWHDVQFEALITSFDFEKRARGGSATGLTWYNLSAKECGPIVTGGIGTTLINALFQALTAWDSINEIIKSYTLDAIATSVVDAGGIVVGQFVDSINAFKAQAAGATALVNGFSDPLASIKTTAATVDDKRKTDETLGYSEGDRPTDYDEGNATGLSPFLRSASGIEASGLDVLEAMRSASGQTTVDDPAGAIRWGSVEGEGSIDALDSIDAQDSLSSVIDAAAWQRSAGSLYGMSRAEFSAYLSATGRSGRAPALTGTVIHRVSEWDTIESITTQYGVDWETILLINDLLPDEALLAGTLLQIPRERGIGQPNAIAGLPTFGSHAGTAAWGRDLPADFRVNSEGGLDTIDGSDVLEQGINWLILQHSAELVQLANETPEVVRTAVLQKRITAILASDRRVASVERIDLRTTPDALLEVAAAVTAINGSTITTGGVR